MIYLDHNATAPLSPAAREAMLALLADGVGNPSSAHAAGRRARAALEQARRTVADVLGVPPASLCFTSGATEANNLALLGALPDPAGAHLVATPIEHASVLGPLRELERRGARVSWLPVDSAGRVTADDVAAALRSETALVSVGWANGEIGTLQPIAAIAATCRARGVLLHVDAAQALGRVPVDANAVDLCTISSHKLGGPLGIGALAIRRGLALRPLMWGGEQERGVRPGTENAAAAAGFAAAVSGLPSLAGLAPLRERLWDAIAPLGGIRRHGPTGDGLPNTLTIGIDGLTGEAVVAALDLEGVAASVGSACAAGSGEPSYVLRAIGCDAAAARAGVRFSLGATTTAAEGDAAAAALRRVVARARGVRARRAEAG
ncbi:MAG TPA: cysteine desulfurase family protein [Candidatus Dormibacteraeota bacterium]|nr:cysteine desulfurase family protein [Candidatus Dormibacteraeota bacterium]